MRIRKSLFLILLCNSVLLFGCRQSDTEIGAQDSQRQNRVVSIYDIDNKVIGELTCIGYSALVQNNILYSKFPKSSSEHDNGVEYWLYNIDDKSDIYLGFVNDYNYEATYEATVYNDHAYLSVATGGYIERDERTQFIYDIDLINHTMQPLLEIEGGIPYNSFTIFKGKLYLAELYENGDTDLIEYDLSQTHDNLPIKHKYDESNVFVHDSIRHMTATNDNIYMFRLDWNDDGEYFLYMDTYDANLNLIDTKNVNEICVPTDCEMDENSIVNERKQWIAHLEVNDAYIYYENFSAIRFLGTVNNGIQHLLDLSITFSMANEAGQCSDSDLLYITYGGDQEDKNKRNRFYLINADSGNIYQSDFYSDDERYFFTWVCRNDNDKILLTMANSRYIETDEKLSDRIYYIDINDLNFIPLNN